MKTLSKVLIIVVFSFASQHAHAAGTTLFVAFSSFVDFLNVTNECEITTIANDLEKFSSDENNDLFYFVSHGMNDVITGQCVWASVPWEGFDMRKCSARSALLLKKVFHLDVESISESTTLDKDRSILIAAYDDYFQRERDNRSRAHIANATPPAECREGLTRRD